MRKTLQKAVGLLVAGLLALGVPAVSMADNLSPDTPYSHQGNTANNQSGTPAPAPAGSSVPTDPDSYNSEFHNSFQNLMPDMPPPGYTAMLGKWTTMMYGFVEFDTMYDSSNSFNNWPFNGGRRMPGQSRTVETTPSARRSTLRVTGSTSTTPVSDLRCLHRCITATSFEPFSRWTFWPIRESLNTRWPGGKHGVLH